MAMALSPRISFSHDIDVAPHVDADEPHRLDRSLILSSPVEDFDFSIHCEISVEDPSPADELFSHGKLLPLSSIDSHWSAVSPVPVALQNKEEDQNIKLKDDILSIQKPKPSLSEDTKFSSVWNVGRSSSVGAGAGRSKLASIPRSRSTGSYPINQDPKLIHQNLQRKSVSKKNAKNCYYYSGGSSKRGTCGNGVRINPVINVPAPFIPRGGSSGGSSTSSSGSGSGSGNSLFAYLLCNCRDKNVKELEVSYSP